MRCPRAPQERQKRAQGEPKSSPRAAKVSISEVATPPNAARRTKCMNIYENHQIQDELYCYDCSSELYDKFNSDDVNTGITITCNGFYGSQGRSIRLNTSPRNNLSEIKKIKYNNYNATNLEMETAIIYAMSMLLGHKAISLNAILANRNLAEYSLNPENTVDNLIEYTLNKL